MQLGYFPNHTRNFLCISLLPNFISPHGEVIFILLIFNNYYKRFTVKLITITSIIDA